MVLKNRSRLHFIILFLSFLAIAGCSKIEVDTFSVRRGNIVILVTSTTYGIIEPIKKATLYPQSQGMIEKVYAKEGKRVKKDEIILKLDNREQEINLKISSDNLKRGDELLKTGIINQARYDEIKSLFDLAKLRYEMTLLKAPFDGIISKNPFEEGDYISGISGISGGIGGNMGKITALQNQSISLTGGEQGKFIEIMDDSSIFINAPFDEVDYPKVRVGMKAQIIPDAFKERTIIGDVIDISPVISTNIDQTRTFLVKVSIKERDGLIPGMSANVEIIIDELKDVIYIPTNVLLHNEGEDYVFLAENGHSVKRVLKPGKSNWEFVEIKEGLREGELVIYPEDTKVLKKRVRVKMRRIVN